jgi:hypothetical protein
MEISINYILITKYEVSQRKSCICIRDSLLPDIRNTHSLCCWTYKVSDISQQHSTRIGTHMRCEIHPKVNYKLFLGTYCLIWASYLFKNILFVCLVKGHCVVGLSLTWKMPSSVGLSESHSGESRNWNGKI